MSKLNLKSGLLFATRLALMGVLATLVGLVFYGNRNVFNKPSNAYAMGDLTVDFHVPPGDPIFVVNNMKPGDMEDRNVDVNNGGTVSRLVAVRGVRTGGIGADPKLETVLDMVIKDGAMPIYGSGSATGAKTLLDFFNDSASGSGVQLNIINPGGHKTYNFKVTLQESAGDEFQATSVTFDILVGFQGTSSGGVDGYFSVAAASSSNTFAAGTLELGNTPPSLSLPLRTLTSITAKVSAVIDHSGSPIDKDLRKRKTSWYDKEDDMVKSFRDEESIGHIKFGVNDNTISQGYANEEQKPFLQGVINYVGSEVDQSNCTSKIEGKCLGRTAYLNYNGHSGYDFPYPNSIITAPAKGKLYKADKADDDPVNRHKGASNPWEKFHTFYIVHDNNYTTWYLHASKLTADIEADIARQGYAEVSTGTPIGMVGKYGLACNKQSNCEHLHFEVRKGKTEVIDPYEFGLWDDTVLTDYISVQIGSPAELRIYDSSGRVTGLVGGRVKNEIPNSEYGEERILLFDGSETYNFQVVGTENGAYDLDIISSSESNYTKFGATGIPIQSNEIHQYEINWDSLSKNEKGVTLQIDKNGDGVFEKTIVSDGELTGDEYRLLTATVVDVNPDTINRKNNNGVMTAYIELPAGFDVRAISTSSVTLNGKSVNSKPVTVGDYDKDGVPDLMVKFDRDTIIPTLPPKDTVATMTVTGNVLHNGKLLLFSGEDSVKVVQ